METVVTKHLMNSNSIKFLLTDVLINDTVKTENECI